MLKTFESVAALLMYSVVVNYTGIGHNLFVQPASSSLIACPGRIPGQVERNTCHCCAT